MDANGTTSIGVGRGDGRSTKGSPSITSRWATCRPMPLQPSTRPDPRRPAEDGREGLPQPSSAEPAPRSSRQLLAVISGPVVVLLPS